MDFSTTNSSDSFFSSLTEYIVVVKVVLILLAAAGAYISFFHTCVEKGKITKFGQTAGAILVCSLILQLLLELVISIDNSRKEQENLETLKTLVRNTSQTVGEIAGVAEDTRKTVQKLSEVSDSISESTFKTSQAISAIENVQRNVVTVKAISESTQKNMLEEDCNYIQGMNKLIGKEVGVLKSIARCPITAEQTAEHVVESKIQVSLAIKPKKLFYNNPEVVNHLAYSINGKIETCQLTKQFTKDQLNQLIPIPSCSFSVSDTDSVLIWLDTTVQRKQFFSDAMTTFKRVYDPKLIDISDTTELLNIDMLFYYKAIHDLSSKYQLQISKKRIDIN